MAEYFIQFTDDNIHKKQEFFQRIRHLGDLTDKFSNTQFNFEPIDEEYEDKLTDIAEEMGISVELI